MPKLLPSIGILLFAILYIFAASLYPGGSQADAHHVGFDWVHNYWCNLLNVYALNGAINPARPFAILAMAILCFGLASFFYQFPRYYSINKKWDATIQISGILSMLFAVLLFTDWHDGITTLSSFFGLFTLLGIVVGLLRHSLKKYIWTGSFCILLLAANNYIYYSGDYLYFLPVLQKITFGLVLFWVVWLNLGFIKKPAS